MKKLIKDGQVALLISHGFGAGWSTWGDDDMVFEPVIAQMILDKTPIQTMLNYLDDKYPNFYTGGLDSLVVEWLEEGVSFAVDEYDGAETLRTSEYLRSTT